MASVLNFCAHNDDQVIGAGGTLAKYAQEGKKVITVIFSYGEKSHPWMKRHEIAKTRVRESAVAGKILGEAQIVYLGLRENHFPEQAKELGLERKIQSLINTYKPEKIFTHSKDDPHPDHRAVFRIVTEAVAKMKERFPVFSFGIWSPISFKKNAVKLVVDITPTFKKKIQAIREHKSQKLAVYTLMTSVYVKALFNGLDHGCWFAEVFTHETKTPDRH